MARYNVKTHGSIIEVASQLFMKQGFNQTSTRQISEAVGITQPNLYYYYKDKEMLYHSVVSREVERLGEKLVQIAEESHYDFKATLLNLVNYILYENERNIPILIYDLETSVSSTVRRDIHQLWYQYYNHAFVHLFQAPDAQLRDNISCEEAARYFFYIILSCFASSRDGDLSSETIVDLFLNGVVEG